MQINIDFGVQGSRCKVRGSAWKIPPPPGRKQRCGAFERTLSFALDDVILVRNQPMDAK